MHAVLLMFQQEQKLWKRAEEEGCQTRQQADTSFAPSTPYSWQREILTLTFRQEPKPLLSSVISPPPRPGSILIAINQSPLALL